MLPTIVHRHDILAGALSLLLFWASLPGGSVRPAAELLFRLTACVLFVLAVAWRGERWKRAQLLSAAALAGVALLGLAQSCSWPVGLAAVVSPEHVRLYAEAAALEATPATPGWVPLTLHAAASRSSAVSWLGAAALLIVACVAGRQRRHRRWLLGALVLAALVQLAYGLLSLHLSSPDGLSLLFRPVGRIRGTFANPSHLSLLLEMTAAAAAAWAWRELSSSSRPRRRRFAAVFPLGLWLLLIVGVGMTGSRAGIAAAGVGLAAQVAFMLGDGRRRGSRLSALTFALVVTALIAFVGRLEIRRYETVSLFEENLRARLLVVLPSLALWSDFPVTGTGLGTFEDGFPLVAPPELTSDRWNRAHNNPLELLVTGGLIGLALGVLAVVGLFPRILRAARRGRSSEDRAAGLAALGALAAVGFHELLDFGLVIPANHLTLLVVLGAAAAVEISPPARAPDSGRGAAVAAR